MSNGVAPPAMRSLTSPRLAALEALDEPRPPVRDHDDSQLAGRGREGGHVAKLLGELDRPPVRLLGAVEVDLLGGSVEGLAERAAQEVLPELEARGELGALVPALDREPADVPREVGCQLVFLGDAQRRGAAQHHLELQVRVAERLRQRGDLGQALEPIAGPAQHVERVVAGDHQRRRDPAAARRRAACCRRGG